MALQSIITPRMKSNLTAVADATVPAGDSGTRALTFGVTLSAPDSRPVTVSYATANGSATAPADYQAVSGTGACCFVPWATTWTVPSKTLYSC